MICVCKEAGRYIHVWGSLDSDVIHFSALVTSGALFFQGQLRPRRLETAECRDPLCVDVPR